ncbi:MAG: amidohydrolase family protein [Pseudomonadales bacterium]|nr:amidohydrolase family protein [Pseudomonadales bacterium]
MIKSPITRQRKNGGIRLQKHRRQYLFLLLCFLFCDTTLATSFPPENTPVTTGQSALSHRTLKATAPDSPVIDMHVHVAGLGYDSDCYINDTMKENFRFPFYLWALGVTVEELEANGDQILFEKLDSKITESVSVDQAVVLALDAYVENDGTINMAETQIFVPNHYIAENTARFDTLLFGASINPNRTDAITQLVNAYNQGAVLVKWIPSIMNIDPADKKHTAFYRKMAELGIPLLSHTGMEKSFASARDELADPLRLELPLQLGVTVIAAHIATTGKSEGQDNFERIQPLFEKYPNLYTDISSLTQINKLGYLAKAMKNPAIVDRMIYGTDWPLQFFPLISPWYHLNHIGLKQALGVSKISNGWDRDVALKKAFGVPDAGFTRFNTLMPKQRTMVFQPPLKQPFWANAMNKPSP